MLDITKSSDWKKVGDTVEIMETRKLSATKNFRLIKIVQKAVVL